MGVNISCRQGHNATALSICCRGSSKKSVNEDVNKPYQPVKISSSDMAETVSKKEKLTEEPDRSGFLKILPTSAKGFILPQHPPVIQSEEGIMNIHELYNFMNVGYGAPYIHDPYYMLILDTRSLDQYTSSHILTARKHTAIDTDFDCHVDFGKLSQYTMIVLYDQNGMCKSEIMQNLQTRIATNSEVYMLTEGFQKFQSVYPYLCSSELVQTEESRKQILTYPSSVLPGCLFQGNKTHAESKVLLLNIGITHIVNITSEMKNLFPKEFNYLRISVEDELSSNLLPRLSQAADFIKDAIRLGGRVLVHCIQGVSRSSTITLSFMIKYLGWPLKEARDYLKICRPVINPNRAFIMQLSAFEENVFGEKLTDPDDVWLN